VSGYISQACALLIHFGLFAAAYVVEGIFLAAVLALTLGGFCLGSFVHHLLGGRGAFAVKPCLGRPKLRHGWFLTCVFVNSSSSFVCNGEARRKNIGVQQSLLSVTRIEVGLLEKRVLASSIPLN